MKKSVLIGSLVAGAFLLPAVASAGVVQGRCDTCHTMHASQDGSTWTPNAVLLKGSGCAACHALSTSNDASGLGGAFNAPQVIATTNTLSGGYFSLTGDSQHNVLDYTTAEDSVYSPTGTGPFGDYRGPGGDAARATRLECVNCHNGSGAHHGTGGPYRMLNGVSGTGDADYGATVGRSGNTYDAASMNTFCAGCHGNFHGTGSGDANIGSYGSWIRHPVNITLADAHLQTSRDYANDYTAAGATALDQSPLGTGGVVMCLSCHVAHGNAQPDMLAWTYNDMNAGNGTRDGGCENCHSYGTSGY